ncbi:MAG: YraN family protein [Acidobacteriota bacterium]
MTLHLTIGQKGEAAAKTYLLEHGYRFVAANWRCKVGEIDLIMDEDDTRVFVEVRTRRKTSYGTGDETVAWQKQRKLIRTVQYYQQKEGWWGYVRFDVVSITVDHDTKKARITHIPYAFDV